MSTSIYLSPQQISRDNHDLARQVSQLLRHYARRRQLDPGVVAGLRASSGDPSALVARGLINDAARSPDPYPLLLRTLPELWWLDLEAGIEAVTPLAEMLSSDITQRLRQDSLVLLARLDRGERPAAWERAADLFASLVGDDPGCPDFQRAQVLARGFGLSLAMSPDWIVEPLRMVDGGFSRPLLRALVRDDRVLDHDRFVAGLLLRGGPRGVAMATAALYFAGQRTVTRVRDLLAVAPSHSMIRVAEAHGLLTLLGEDGVELSQQLRCAFLTQAWQQNDLKGLPWWRAFRGEELVYRCLPELGDGANALARDAATGVSRHLGTERMNDPARREAIAGCIARVIETDRDYIAPLRIAEGRVRDLGRSDGTQAMAQAMRAYAMLVIAVAQRVTRTSREVANRLYGRVLRLRKAHPDLLPRDLFPDTLERALAIGEPDRAARRWVGDVIWAPEPAVKRETSGRPAPHPEDPLPAADEVVATGDGLLPLPAHTATWVGAASWSPTRLFSWVVPLPYRHLFTRVASWFGMTPTARFVLSSGEGAVVVNRRVFGSVVSSTRRAIPAGCLFPFPEGGEKADRLLGRWSALLILCGTLGTWLALSGKVFEPLTATLAGSAIALFGLFGYLGALGLRRILGDGAAVAVLDNHGEVRVWEVSTEARWVLLAPPDDTFGPSAQ